MIVFYSPGISDFHQKIIDAFTSELVASNWRVDIVTASGQTPMIFQALAFLSSVSQYMAIINQSRYKTKLPGGGDDLIIHAECAQVEDPH